MTECIPKYPEHSKCSINIGNRKGGRERQRKVEGGGGEAGCCVCFSRKEIEENAQVS